MSQEKLYLVQLRGDKTRHLFSSSRPPKEFAVVETEWGEEVAKVLGEVSDGKAEGEIKHFLSRDDKAFRSYLVDAKKKEKEALRVFRRLVKKHRLDREGMKPLKSYLTFDRRRLLFYYTAPQRVDFRNLLKDLISLFPYVIRLQQINRRQASIMLGGIGPCGRELCCARFLRSLPMIDKEKVELQISPAVTRGKLKGVCGGWRCCLMYEASFYEKEGKYLPKIGEVVKIKGKEWEVVGRNVLTGEVTLQDKEGNKMIQKWPKSKKRV